MAFSLIAETRTTSIEIVAQTSTARPRPIPLSSRVSEVEKLAHSAFIVELGAAALWAYYAEEEAA